MKEFITIYVVLLSSVDILSTTETTTQLQLQSGTEPPQETGEPICEATTCHLHATCSINATDIVCTCNPGFTGDGYNCTAIDPCSSATCHPHATCTVDGDHVTCKCSDGFVGDGYHCIENPCASDSCLNNGLCVPLLSNNRRFQCLCQPPFTGDKCQCRNDWCEIHSDECGDLICESLCDTYACRCNNTGFTIDLQKKTCVDIDECEAFDVCDNPHQTCKNSFGSYKCECESGFRMDSNGTKCEDVNECESSVCGQNARCTNTHGSYMCHCEEGYQRIGNKCEDADECKKMWDNCQHFCINTVGGYNCTCKEDFQLINGNRCEYQGNDTCSKYCKHGVCYQEACDCFRGYHFLNETGLCEDIDECEEESTCGNFSDCFNLHGGYQCMCHSGYKYNGSQCVDRDECSNPTSCGELAICINLPGDYNCTCPNGYQFKGRDCEVIDHCKMKSGHEFCARRNAVCWNEENSYVCRCKTGFIMNDQQCQSATVTLSGKFTLLKGFKKSLLDKRSVDYKALESNIIKAISTATHLLPSEIRITEFSSGSVISNFAVMLNNNLSVEEFNKMLYAACHPLSASEGICLLSSKIALISRESLLQSTTYFNACAYPMVDQYCPTDLTVCEDLGWSNYNCHCKKGLRLLSQKDKILLCVDVDECLDSNICEPNSRCRNYFGGYSCECDIGYMPVEGVCQEICGIDPCLNDGICVWHGWHDYRCLCQDDYHGEHCQHPSKKFRDLLLTLYIVAGSLGSLVVFTCLGASIWQKRFQKKQLSLMNSTYEADTLNTRLKAESSEVLNPGSGVSSWRL